MCMYVCVCVCICMCVYQCVCKYVIESDLMRVVTPLGL